MINDSASVKEQYASSSNLTTRISIHDKYSTNKTGFGNWIFSNYDIAPGMKVLELGCGTGSMWKGRESLIRSCGSLILSDLSDAMTGTARGNIGSYPNVEYRVIDICDIPYGNGTFDIVIANMMLYHVPDIGRGLSEVRRVLKDNGTFYCATFGIHGIIEYLSSILAPYGMTDDTKKNFTLQNGSGILLKFFEDVQRKDYEDSLAVTDISDLVDYVYSLGNMTTLNTVPKETIAGALSGHMVNGVLNVPKEYGMFIAR